MNRILVTGGAGFVGHHLCKRLSGEGLAVNVIDDFSTGLRENVVEGVNLFEGDIRDKALLNRAAQGCDTIFHLAARVELQKSIVDPADCFSVNVEGTAGVVMEALKVDGRRLVFASSCAVYPLHPNSSLKEDMAVAGETPYALSKRAGEQILEIYNKIRKLNSCSLRCFNIYGPRQRPDSQYAAVIPRFMNMVIKGEPLTIYGDGLQARDFIHVEDVVEAYMCAAESTANGIFNAATGIATGIRELAGLIIRIHGKGEAVHLSSVPGDASFSLGNIDLIKKELRFNPKISLESGLDNLHSYFISNKSL